MTVVTTRPAYLSARPAPRPDGRSWVDPRLTPPFKVITDLQVVGNLIIRAEMSDRQLVGIHLSNVIYLPDNHGTTLSFRELQRGGMRIQHGTTNASAPSSSCSRIRYMCRWTRNMYLPL